MQSAVSRLQEHGQSHVRTRSLIFLSLYNVRLSGVFRVTRDVMLTARSEMMFPNSTTAKHFHQIICGRKIFLVGSETIWTCFRNFISIGFSTKAVDTGYATRWQAHDTERNPRASAKIKRYGGSTLLMRREERPRKCRKSAKGPQSRCKAFLFSSSTFLIPCKSFWLRDYALDQYIEVCVFFIKLNPCVLPLRHPLSLFSFITYSPLSLESH